MYFDLVKRKKIVQEIIIDNQNRDFSAIKFRDIDLPIHCTKIISLTGVRRSVKTYLLMQTMHKLLKSGIEKEAIVNINFEDERIDFESFELDTVLQAYRELYPHKYLSRACSFSYK